MPTTGRFRYLEAVPRAGVRERGVLLLLHAFPLNARMWEPQLELAGGGWRVIAPQFRGMDEGGGGDRKAASMDDYAADTIDLLDALHVEDAAIAGLSMGGYVAFAMFRRAPTYFKALVLADTRYQADTPEGREGRLRMIALVREKGAAGVAAEMLPKLLGEETQRTRPDVVERVRALALASAPDAIEGAITALMTRPDSAPVLRDIRCPTLIIVGDSDVITPPALSDDMHRAIPGSELVVIERSGHLANIERPDAFNAALARFLEHRV